MWKEQIKMNRYIKTILQAHVEHSTTIDNNTDTFYLYCRDCDFTLGEIKNLEIIYSIARGRQVALSVLKNAEPDLIEDLMVKYLLSRYSEDVKEFYSDLENYG